MYDPISIWMKSTIFWAKLFQQQQDLYWRALGTVADTIPHESAADLAREADKLGKAAKPRATTRRAPVSQRKAPAKPAAVPA